MKLFRVLFRVKLLFFSPKPIEIRAFSENEIDHMFKCFGFSAPLLAIYYLIWQCSTGVFWWASARRLG